jgi:hypothetical protein
MGLIQKGGLGCVGVLVVLMVIGYFTTTKEAARRAALTPQERAKEDSNITKIRALEDAKEKLSPAYQIGLAHFAVKRRAKDPDAVQFREERLVIRGDTAVVCGEANMKNAFGGYIGFRPYVMISGAVIMENDASEVGERVVNEFFKKCQ